LSDRISAYASCRPCDATPRTHTDSDGL
jgi:hypothetical protein